MVLLAELTSPAAARLARDPNAVVLLPLGAIEQHGPHLPLLVDWRGAEELARRVARAGGRCVAVGGDAPSSRGRGRRRPRQSGHSSEGKTDRPAPSRGARKGLSFLTESPRRVRVKRTPSRACAAGECAP